MKMRLFLLPFVLIGTAAGIFNAHSTTEIMIWIVIGIAGLVGVATLGLSSKQVIQRIKNSY